MISATVVLIHGLGSSPAVWSRVDPLLLTHSAHVVRPVLRGEVSIEHEADWIARYLNERRIRSAVVAGHSMGGLVATALAEICPYLVGRLILINTPPRVESRISARGAAERLLAVPLLGAMAWRLAPRARVIAGLATAFAPGTPVPEAFVSDLRATGRSAFLRSTRAIDDYLRLRPLDARLARLAQPTSVLFGLRDQRVDPESIRHFRGLANVAVTTLPEAGHTPPWEAPTAVAADIVGPAREH
ncbi:alpha/beta fold hydrolase [Nocardia sp. NPDC058518]|uniref:alpha/beta fold hydrolase n=1 Tax=Nocardia sp. NPDC058518 TaxID=3346534 RepID=UPI0036678E72